MWQNQPNHSSYTDSFKALEDHIQHANSLASSLPGDCDGNYFQMKLSYSPFAPLFLHFIQWLDLSCTDTLPLYLGLLHILIFNVSHHHSAVIYPSLRLIQGEFNNDRRNSYAEVNNRKRLEKVLNENVKGDDECGICMENNMKMVLPNCGHSFCISCFHNWYMRSESCPYCRGSMSSITPTDLWVVIGNSDLVDRFTFARDNLRQLYLFIQTLPPISP
ncbi:hypothetical protein ACSQ67_002368 [Phaseolus vulgaris]